MFIVLLVTMSRELVEDDSCQSISQLPFGLCRYLYINSLGDPVTLALPQALFRKVAVRHSASAVLNQQRSLKIKRNWKNLYFGSLYVVSCKYCSNMLLLLFTLAAKQFKLTNMQKCCERCGGGSNFCQPPMRKAFQEGLLSKLKGASQQVLTHVKTGEDQIKFPGIYNITPDWVTKGSVGCQAPRDGCGSTVFFAKHVFSQIFSDLQIVTYFQLMCLSRDLIRTGSALFSKTSSQEMYVYKLSHDSPT